ncbi:MAG: hemerythrin family protein [Proteobacteria bacterium]|nr:hemerythrin family protein [Pseudomonadota bacterium]
MSHPKFPLGVDLMDDDHTRIEEMLARSEGLADAELPGHLAACRAEIAEHFAREEALLRDHAVPVLACHIAQHNRLVADIDATIAATGGNIPSLRAYLAHDLPNLIMSHIASVDQISARFLAGELPAEIVANLRLPEETAP